MKKKRPHGSAPVERAALALDRATDAVLLCFRALLRPGSPTRGYCREPECFSRLPSEPIFTFSSDFFIVSEEVLA